MAHPSSEGLPPNHVYWIGPRHRSLSAWHCLPYCTSDPDCEAGRNWRPSLGVLPEDYASVGTELQTPGDLVPTSHWYGPLRQNVENKGTGQPQHNKIWVAKRSKFVKPKKSRTSKNQKSTAKSSSKLWRTAREMTPQSRKE